MGRIKSFVKSCALLSAAVAVAFGQQPLILKATSGQGAAVVSKYGLTVLRQLDSKGDVNLVTAGDTTATATFVTAAAADSTIASVESDRGTAVGEADSTSKAQNSMLSGSSDPLVAGDPTIVNYYGSQVRQGYASQNVVAMIHIADAQASYGIGSGTVAVIDTGIDATHPMLAGSVVPGYDFISNTAGIPSDFTDVSLSTIALLDQLGQPILSSQADYNLNLSTIALLDLSTIALLDLSTIALLDGNHLPAAFGHGTMVSGLIHLVAPGAKIMPLKAFHADGTGNISDIVRAIYFAADNGARAINMSFSSTTASPALTAAIAYAKSKGAICVTSAGNAGKQKAVYPAGSGAVGVGSVNSADVRSYFSNYGDTDSRIAAPGEALITAYPGGGYAGVWGTSFSTALVSGTVALINKANPRASNGDIMDALDKGKNIASQDMGDARLDVLAAVQSVAKSSSDSASGSSTGGTKTGSTSTTKGN